MKFFFVEEQYKDDYNRERQRGKGREKVKTRQQLDRSPRSIFLWEWLSTVYQVVMAVKMMITTFHDFWVVLYSFIWNLRKFSTGSFSSGTLCNKLIGVAHWKLRVCTQVLLYSIIIVFYHCINHLSNYNLLYCTPGLIVSTAKLNFPR